MKTNKKIRKSITAIRDKKTGIPQPFGHYYKDGLLNMCYMNGWGPDNYYEDSEIVMLGTVSIKANTIGE